LNINTPAGAPYYFNGWIRNCSGVAVVNENPDSTLAIIKDGPGTQIFAGLLYSVGDETLSSINYSGSTTIHNGVLEYDTSCTLPGDISGAGQLKIGGETTTFIAGGLFDLAAAQIDNGNTLVVASTGENVINQVTGEGALLVGPDATLTASSITVGALTIGGELPPLKAMSPAQSPAPVPEPATWILLLVGLACAVALKKHHGR